MPVPDDDAAPPLEPAVLRARLARAGSRWRDVTVVERTGSTNADLAQAARAGAADGRVLLTEHQAAGRGRLGRRWVAPPRSGLAMSVLLRPQRMQGWGWLPLLTGLAVGDAVRATTGADAVLKWPNDVLVDERKLAGILAERVETDEGPAVVLGAGVNVGLTAEQLPVPTATSVRLLAASVPGVLAVDRTTLAAAVLTALELRLAQWADVDDALAVDYRRRCATLGRSVRLVLADREVAGTAEAVDAQGRLVLDTAAGRQTFSAGDVVHAPLGPRG